jgi:WD40 repeat protein
VGCDKGACIRVFKGHSDWVTSVAFSLDGRHALSGSNDASLRLWDVTSGACIRVFNGHSSWVNSVALSPDGFHALSGSYDTSLRLWDLTSGACIRVFEGHSNWINSVAFSPDGLRALSGSSDGTIRLWDTGSGAELARCYGFTDGSWAIISPDGRYDSSEHGECPHLRWTVGLNSYPVTKFKYRYYTPGLMAKVRQPSLSQAP